MPSTSESSMGIWGTTYVGTGEILVASRAVEQALAHFGVSVRTIVAGEDYIRLEGRQQAPWHRVLRRRLPQRVQWNIEKSGEALRLTSDFRLFRWYSVVLSGLWSVIGACFIFDILNATQGWLSGPSGSLAASFLLLLAISLMPVVIQMLGALGGRCGDRLWLDIANAMERSGGQVEPKGYVNLRYSLHLLGFFTFTLILTLWFTLSSLRQTSLPLPMNAQGFLLALAGLIALLVIALALKLSRKGFSLRLYPILTGLMTMLPALLLLQAILLPWWLSSGINYSSLGANLRPFGLLQLGSTFLLAATAFFLFFYFGVGSTPIIRSQTLRLRAHRGTGVHRLAVGGESPRPFQGVFVVVWLLLTGLSLASLAFLVVCAVQGVYPIFERPELQLVQRATQTLAAVLGLAGDNRWLSWTVSGFWLLGASLASGLLLVSTGQLYFCRRSLRHRLADRARRSSPRRRQLEEILRELCRQLRLPPIKLALRNGSSLPTAERFGLWRVERYVEISESFLDLPAPRLKAALAHEVAHHYLGHLAVRSLALWLGRFSFTGDGFASALLHSFGYELQADRVALEILEIPPEDLKEFLESLPSHRPFVRPPLPSSDLSFAHRWSLFLTQYCCGLSQYYWHPVAEERIAAIRGSG